ncbi:MAG: LPS export ABC transporter periplasmic protein LptC [Mailhella sp.]|nr:LPS export ABC transporter periplasmic protein LptC [Mailhella sp.]
MNASLRRTLALATVGLLAWGSWYGWMSWKTSQSIHALKDVVRSADLDRLLTNPPAEVSSAVDLAIRDLTLTQGREGRKSFDLKAKWAALNQESGDVTVREPEIAYMMEDDENGSPRVIHATSKIGRVEDGNQKVSMSEDVRAQHEENVLTSDYAVFINQLSKLTFPGGATLAGPELSGSCARMTWDLNTNTLMGDHGVKMRWYPPKREEASPEEDTDAAKDAMEAS